MRPHAVVPRPVRSDRALPVHALLRQTGPLGPFAEVVPLRQVQRRARGGDGEGMMLERTLMERDPGDDYVGRHRLPDHELSPDDTDPIGVRPGNRLARLYRR